MHRFSKMRVVSQNSYAARAVAFGLLSHHQFQCLLEFVFFYFSVGAISASTCLALRSVSTDDVAATSSLRPCNV